MQENYYPLKDAATGVSRILDIDLTQIYLDAGLIASPDEAFEDGVSVRQFFDAWNAAEGLYGQPDMGLKVGSATANAPTATVFYSLVSSSDYLTGIKRLSKYKNLYEPIATNVVEDQNQCVVVFNSQDPTVEMPVQLAIAHIAFSVTTINKLTNKTIFPIGVELNKEASITPALADMIGGEISFTDKKEVSLFFDMKDAKQPFLTENASLWAKVESQLIEDIETLERQQSMSGRVKRLILSNITTRSFSMKYLHKELGVSQSTLQRRLFEEGTTFRELLDKTRNDLAVEYLKQNRVGMKEISYMLGYSDPNSFYRCFKKNRGQTPAAYREAWFKSRTVNTDK